jgi:hypothetical protein
LLIQDIVGIRAGHFMQVVGSHPGASRTGGASELD